MVVNAARTAPAAKAHAVYWSQREGYSLDYQAKCDCGWSFAGRYSVIQKATTAHLEATMPKGRA